MNKDVKRGKWKKKSLDENTPRKFRRRNRVC